MGQRRSPMNVPSLLNEPFTLERDRRATPDQRSRGIWAMWTLSRRTASTACTPQLVGTHDSRHRNDSLPGRYRPPRRDAGDDSDLAGVPVFDGMDLSAWGRPTSAQSALTMSRVRTRLPPGPASHVTVLISIRPVQKIMRFPRNMHGEGSQSSTDSSNLHISLLICTAEPSATPAVPPSSAASQPQRGVNSFRHPSRIAPTPQALRPADPTILRTCRDSTAEFAWRFVQHLASFCELTLMETLVTRD